MAQSYGVQMGLFDLRDRKGLYSLPDILTHEALHCFGYRVHGAAHDEAIRKARQIFGQHRVYLADHPEYVPEAVSCEYSIEDARNFGAEQYGRYTRIAIARDEEEHQADLGPFRGHSPHVQTKDEVLSELAAMKNAHPLPVEWDGAIDLLSPLDPRKDVVSGPWVKLGDQIMSSEEPNSRVQLGAAPQGSYRLETQFTRISGDCMALMLPVGETAGLLVVSGCSGKVSGLSFVRGMDADRNETTRDGKLSNGEKHTLLVKVLVLEAGRARIEVVLDGEEYIEWEGPRSALIPNREWRLKRIRAVGIGAYNAFIVFHSCQLQTLDDAWK